MTYSLWSAAGLLGHAQLSEVEGVPTRAPVMNGPFTPSAAFGHVWPVMEAWHRCQVALFASVPRVAPGVTPEDYREQLLAHVSPASLRAYHDAESAVLALGLELRDEAGEAVRDVSIQIFEWELFASLPDSQRMPAEAEAVREGISTRGYGMLVTRARPATAVTDR